MDKPVFNSFMGGSRGRSTKERHLGLPTAPPLVKEIRVLTLKQVRRREKVNPEAGFEQRMRVGSWLVGMGTSFPLWSLLWFLSSPRLQLGQCSAQCLFTPFLSTRKGMAPNLSDAASASEGFCGISGRLLGACPP